MKHTLVLNNLSAAQLLAVSAALFDEQFGTTHDTTQTCSDPCTQPEEVAAAEASENAVSSLDIILEALRDPRYEQRSVNSLAEKAGVATWDVEGILNIANVAYSTKTRRSDGATLIGLVKDPVAVPAAPAEVPAPANVAKFDILMDLLKDSRFTWRTVATLVEKTGYHSKDEIEAALDDAGVDYETTYRNSDGAPIMALSSRV